MTEPAASPARGIPAAVDHGGYNVPDLDAAVAFFTGVCGFELLERSAPRLAIAGHGAGGQTSVRLAMLRYGGVMVELLEFRRPGQPWTIPAIRDPGGYHLAFTVTDL
jgi:glyoxylase I family protein